MNSCSPSGNDEVPRKELDAFWTLSQICLVTGFGSVIVYVNMRALPVSPGELSVVNCRPRDERFYGSSLTSLKLMHKLLPLRSPHSLKCSSFSVFCMSLPRDRSSREKSANVRCRISDWLQIIKYLNSQTLHTNHSCTLYFQHNISSENAFAQKLWTCKHTYLFHTNVHFDESILADGLFGIHKLLGSNILIQKLKFVAIAT